MLNEVNWVNLKSAPFIIIRLKISYEINYWVTDLWITNDDDIYITNKTYDI